MYNNFLTSARTSDGENISLPVEIKPHQGSVLSHYLFALVMDEVTKNIQRRYPLVYDLGDDVVLVDMGRDGMNRKLELW